MTGAILTLGLGTFGTVNLLPTLGYGTGAAPPPVVTVQPSGGYYEPRTKRRTDLRAERIRLGILREPKAVEAVQQVATAVLEASKTALAIKEQEQAVMLRRMLIERGMAVEARVNAILTRIIAEEVERQRQAAEDWQIVMFMEGM